MLIYIAGPYTSNPEEGTRRAIEAGRRLIGLNHVPIIPHLSHFMNEPPIPEDTWLAMGCLKLVVSQALFRLDDLWGPSPGSQNEVRVAISLGKKVYFEKDGYPPPDPIPIWEQYIRLGQRLAGVF